MPFGARAWLLPPHAWRHFASRIYIDSWWLTFAYPEFTPEYFPTAAWWISRYFKSTSDARCTELPTHFLYQCLISSMLIFAFAFSLLTLIIIINSAITIDTSTHFWLMSYTKFLSSSFINNGIFRQITYCAARSAHTLRILGKIIPLDSQLNSCCATILIDRRRSALRLARRYTRKPRNAWCA